ncbi:hypothetical protein [Alteromonas flava]|uniref:hypothetical protein n=1 Tax=Alteromonas flava TaxID=2048003 RepID=UPI000C2846A3|nr:hypothetical protein [Alteromonas flava]
MNTNNTTIEEIDNTAIEAVSGAGSGGIIGGWAFGLGMNALGYAANNGGFALMEQHNMALDKNRL